MPDWRYAQELWLPKAELEKYLPSEDAAFLHHFQTITVYEHFDRMVALSTIPLNAIAHHYFGLDPNYFSHTRSVGGKHYKLVRDNTLQLLQYLVGTNPQSGNSAQLGDSLAGEHTDSSTGTLGDVSRDPYHCLEVLTNRGDWIAPVLGKPDHYFFQFGKTFAALAITLAEEGQLDLGSLSYGPMNATEHRVRRKDLEHKRPGVFLFNHPDLDMPIGPSTARGILSGDLNSYIAAAERK